MSEPARVRLAPSLLAADFAHLEEAVAAVADQVEVFHVDVMDGHFVPNLSMGPAVVESLRRLTDRKLDVHLMVSEPDRWVEPFREAGADWISVHAEATPHLERTLSRIREAGARAGVAFNPATPLDGLEYVLEDGDLVLVMSVNPGFGGQRFLPRSLSKLAQARRQIESMGLRDVEVEVDGGVEEANIAACVRAGAQVLVAGSSVYGVTDPAAAARRLLDEARAAAS